MEQAERVGPSRATKPISKAGMETWLILKSPGLKVGEAKIANSIVKKIKHAKHDSESSCNRAKEAGMIPRKLSSKKPYRI